MDKITESLLNSFTDQNELNHLDISTQFEHFSNYSIVSKNFRGSFELEDIHTGSGNDCGIDGLFILANGRLITEINELDDIIDSSKVLDADICFIQSKTSSSFNSAEIGTFFHGIVDFLSDKPRLKQNENIKFKKTLWERIIYHSSYMINRRPICKVYYICTGRSQSDQNITATLARGKEEIESIGLFESVSIEAIGASEIQKLYHETKNKLSSTINFQNRITLPDIDGVSEAYLGVIPFPEYLKLIQDENQIIHSLFDDNIRDFQGENSVNIKIKNTLTDGKFNLFCVLNNGVTLVASSITPAGNRFTIRDYQVVNGCQTSHVLHDCQRIEGIESVYVPIKIIVTENEDIKTNITLATNSQTEVKTEQLEALSVFQKQLELYFAAEKNALRLYYERRSQQYNSVSGIKRSQIISIPIQIKSFAAMFLNSPHLVSGYYGTIVKRFTGQIFAEEHQLSLYYVSALAYYRIEQFFRNNELKAENKKVRFHIMLLVRMLAMGFSLDQFNSKQIDKKSEELKKILLDENQAIEIFKRAESIFESSPLDSTKRQYKSEADTELLINHFRENF